MPLARPTLPELIDRAVADLEARMPGLDAQLRRSLARALMTAHAGAVHGLYGHLDWQSRQLFPDTADAANLERWAGIWGLTRKDAVAAQGSVDFTSLGNTLIPAGSELQLSDGTAYTTDADATIAGGVATVAVTASEGGQGGNAEAGSKLTLTAPIAGINSEAAVAAGGLIGGIDEESDADLFTRLLLRIKQGVPNGKPGDYEQWALEVTSVTRAWDFPAYTGLGTVGVTFALDNDAMDATIIPDAAKVTEVQTHIDAVRPAPATVTVFAPTAVALNLTIQLTPNTTAVQDAVTEEIKDLLRRDAEPGGTLKLSRIREAISLADGEEDHVLVSPVADVVYNAGELAVMGVITWQ